MPQTRVRACYKTGAAAKEQHRSPMVAASGSGEEEQQSPKKQKRAPRRWMAEAAAEAADAPSGRMGYYWLLQLKEGGVASARRMSWLDLLCQKNMGTKGLVSFYDEATNASGCFCVLKTARTLQSMNEKLGHFCHAQKLVASFASEHPLYLEYGRRGLLCMEQKGIPDLVASMQIADRPPPIVMEGSHHDEAAEGAAACHGSGGSSSSKKLRRSFACQVNAAVAVAQHPAAAAEAHAAMQAAATLAEANQRMHAMQRQLRDAQNSLSDQQRETDRLKAQARLVGGLHGI